MGRYEGSDYEIAWRIHLNRNPQMKRFFIVWDSLNPKRRREITAIARALAQQDASPKSGARGGKKRVIDLEGRREKS